MEAHTHTHETLGATLFDFFPKKKTSPLTSPTVKTRNRMVILHNRIPQQRHLKEKRERERERRTKLTYSERVRDTVGATERKQHLP